MVAGSLMHAGRHGEEGGDPRLCRTAGDLCGHQGGLFLLLLLCASLLTPRCVYRAAANVVTAGPDASILEHHAAAAGHYGCCSHVPPVPCVPPVLPWLLSAPSMCVVCVQAPSGGEVVRFLLEDGAPVEYQQIVVELAPTFGRCGV